MAKSLEIPQDIIDSVIAAVGNDIHLLKQCSLVSSSFLLPSRKQLFSRITLRNDQTCQGIHQILVQNPNIQPFVRAITLMDRGSHNLPLWMYGTSLLAILRLPFGCLECFSIDVSRDERIQTFWNWNSFSSELNDALSNIIHSSNLKTLYLKGITKVPLTFFLHIVHLTTLELHSISTYDFCDNLSSLIRAASKGAPMASHKGPGVIDRCVWRFGREHARYEVPFICLFLTNSGQRRSFRPTQSIFLPFMCRLRFLEIYIDHSSATMHDFDILSFLMASLCISLTSPATLEHLEFNIRFRCSIYDFANTGYTFCEILRDANVWSHLDSMATRPTGSQLQRVDINISYCFRTNIYRNEPQVDEDEVKRAVLDGLPLLRTTGILFVEATLGT